MLPTRLARCACSLEQAAVSRGAPSKPRRVLDLQPQPDLAAEPPRHVTTAPGLMAGAGLSASGSWARSATTLHVAAGQRAGRLRSRSAGAPVCLLCAAG